MKHKALLVAMILVLAAVPVMVPVMAQGNTGHTVAFDGFSFTFDPDVASKVNIVTFAGDPVDFSAPGGPEPPYTQFVLYDAFPVPESFLDSAGGIRVYRVADLEGYDLALAELAALQTLLDTQPDLAAYMAVGEAFTPLPFLPTFPAAQVIRARAQYVEVAGLSGISYLTVYSQGPQPFVAAEFMYTFQGISADGQYFIAATFPVNAGLFPAEVPADFDYETFLNGMQDYLTESVNTLNMAAPEAFTPSLDALDALVASFALAS